ncbi:hypothetical protein GPECTOR_8g84 [Gonium pectorale]|uniref:Uncharacterized protein n=1 Tax=Gonium pectorale TaxID=33097 RepID=A0A150GTI3_GONPE|nr:hypothetical protein GPECTOR_8g84 [Gonium pectorale]|eukprot:KXZ53093.1 hypothetical protein GPECTOR_8g84 [Gonium pectorale]
MSTLFAIFGMDMDVAALVRAMRNNTHLTELYASSHALVPRTAALLADMLAGSGSLRALCVGDAGLGDEGVEALARGVASSSSLTRLDLTGKGVGAHGAAALAGALTACASLSHLVLSANPKLGDAGLAALCNGAPVPGDGPTAPPVPVVAWAGLATLELQGCGVTAAGVRALAESPNCGRLVVLRLDGNQLGPEGGGALRALLQSAAQLRELHLRGTELGDEGGEELAGGLAASASDAAEGGRPKLQLDLGDCGLGPKTIAALSSAFTAGATLASLSLAANGSVADGEVARLARALESRGAEALPHLDLSATQAGPLAVEALSRMPGLQHLSLVGCPLRASGAAALASSLSAGGWGSLEELCISGTGLASADAGPLFGALAEGGAPKLKSLEVGANPAAQDDGFQALLQKLRSARDDLAVYWRSGDDPVPVVS